jgi:hypothetical protein
MRKNILERPKDKKKRNSVQKLKLLTDRTSVNLKKGLTQNSVEASGAIIDTKIAQR